MARVGQFKALGSALGGYKKTLANVQSKDYAKRYADVRAQEQVSLYNEIGGTVANIIGIAQETKALNKLKPLDKPDMPSVGVDESYGEMQPDALEGVEIVKGKEIDFSPDLTMDGEALSMRGPAFESLGKLDPPPSEQMPRAGLDTLIQESQSKNPNARTNFSENINTSKKSTSAQDQFKVLDETKELYEQTLSSDDKAFNAMNTYETGIGPNVGQKAGVSDIMKATESQGFFDSSTGQFVKEASPSSTPTGESFAGGHSGGKVYRENEDFTRTQMGEIPGLFGGRESTRTGRGFDVTRQYDFVDTAGDTTTYDVTGKSNKSVRSAESRADRTALSMAVQGRMSEFPMSKPERPSVKNNAYKKDMSPDPLTDDMVMDTISDTGLGDFNFSKDNVIKQARAVGGDRADELEMVFGMESSFGQDPNAKGNILQIKNASLRQEAQDAGIDFSNPSQVSKFYMEKTNEFTKDFNNYSVQSGSLAGKNINVYSEMNKAGLDKKGVNYLTWQQGRMGVLDMVTALKTGNLGKETRSNMLNNVSEQQKKELLFYSDPKNTKKFIKQYLNIQSKKMKGYKS